jgi:hypothetical protein
VVAYTVIVLLLLAMCLDYIPVLQPDIYRATFWYLEEGIYIEANATSSEPFADDLPVTVHAVGSIGPDYANISNVCLCFGGAYYLDLNGQIIPNPNREPFAGPILTVTTTRPSEGVTQWLGGAYLVGPSATIEWQNPMESSPAIMVTYVNTTIVNGIVQNVFASQRYPSESIHIESHTAIESEKTEFKFFYLAAAAVPITILEGVLIPRIKLRRKSKSQASGPHQRKSPIRRKKPARRRNKPTH